MSSASMSVGTPQAEVIASRNSKRFMLKLNSFSATSSSITGNTSRNTERICLRFSIGNGRTELLDFPITIDPLVTKLEFGNEKILAFRNTGIQTKEGRKKEFIAMISFATCLINSCNSFSK